MPIIIAITGASGSGKTTLARNLCNELQPNFSTGIISMDNYYKCQDNLTMAQRVKTNYDHPDAFDLALLQQDLQQLKKGQAIELPTYDFSVHNRTEQTHAFPAVDVCVVEGILPIYTPELVTCYDQTYYLDVPLATCLERRKQRDLIERGRTEQCIQEQFETTVIPGFKQYIASQKTRADYTLSCSKQSDVVVEQLSSILPIE